MDDEHRSNLVVPPGAWVKDTDQGIVSANYQTYRMCRKAPDFSHGEKVKEGLCAQVMHIGFYDDEPPTVAALEEFIASQGYRTEVAGLRQHHEIYLSDPRRTAPERLKTVIRHPIVRR